MYSAQGYAVIWGRRGEGTEGQGILSSVKFPDHADTFLKQRSAFSKKALLKSSNHSCNATPGSIKKY